MPIRSIQKHEAIADEPGHLLGSLLLVVLIGPIVYRVALRLPPNPTLTGVYALLLGSVFLCSYFFARKSFVFRWFAWLCEHGSAPASRKMAFFYAGLLYVMGIMSILYGAEA